MLAPVLLIAISVSLHLALASASPRVAIIVMSGAEDARAPLEAALAARTDVVAQPRALVDEVLAAAGRRCATDDVTCWVKLGLDGDFDAIVMVVRTEAGSFELRLVDIATGIQVRRSALVNPQEAAAALGRLFDAPAPEPVAALAEAPLHWLDVGLITVGATGAVIGATCGIAAAVIDVPLIMALWKAEYEEVGYDTPSYYRDEATQNLLLGCFAAASVVAAAATVGALVLE
jgi:hypothetical protein